MMITTIIRNSKFGVAVFRLVGLLALGAVA